MCHYLEPLKHRKYDLIHHTKNYDHLFKILLIKISEMDSDYLKIIRFICLA